MIVAGTTIHIDAGITLDLNKVIAATQIDRLNIRHRQRIPGIPEGQGIDAGTKIDIEAELTIGQEDVFIGSCAGQFGLARRRTVAVEPSGEHAVAVIIAAGTVRAVPVIGHPRNRKSAIGKSRNRGLV